MWSRTVLGFVTAPLVLPIGMLLTTQRESHGFSDVLLEIMVFGLVWYIYPLLFTLVFALPLYLLLNRWGLVRWWVSLGAGLLVGAIGALSNNGQPAYFSIRLIALGGIAGLVFWAVVVGRDRSRVPTA